MDCTRCRSLLSDYMDGAMAPALRKEMQAHLTTCEACDRELRDLGKALHLLRRGPREEPPAGLIQETAERMAAAVEGPAAMPRARGLPWRVLAAAATILIVSLAAIKVFRERSWRDQAVRLEETLATTRNEMAELAGQLEEGRVEAARLRAAVSAAQAAETAARNDARTQTAAAEASRKTLEARLAKVEESSRADLLRLQEALARSRDEAARLAKEVDRVALALAEAEKVPGKAVAEPKAPPRLARDAEVALAAAPPRRSSVFFVDRGDRLELKTQGPRGKVIDELLAIAGDENNPATASLALSTLENLLGRSAAPQPVQAERTDGFLVWWNKRTGDAALGIGPGAAPANGSAADGAQDRRRRLKALQETWNSEKNSSEE